MATSVGRCGVVAFATMAAISVWPTRAAAQCVGDCSGDGSTAINELIVGVNIALGSAPLAACSALDSNANGTVEINELVAAVNVALGVPCSEILVLLGLCLLPGPAGLESCPAGTTINVFRCANPADCLRNSASLEALDLGSAGTRGEFTLRVDAAAASGEILVFEAEVSSGVVFRAIDIGPAAAGRRFSTAPELVIIAPSSEAAVRLIDDTGLPNVEREEIASVVAAVDAANPAETFAGLEPAAAATQATAVARDDVGVQTALKRGPLAFVSNFTGGTISVLDTASNAEIAEIPADSPTGIAIAGGGRIIYVSNPRSGATVEDVLVIDTLTLLANLAQPALAVIARIAVQDNPLGLALSPDESLLAVANTNSDTVSLVDTAAVQVATTLPVGDGPEAVAITPDGATALVSNVNAGTVSILDLAEVAVVATVPVGNDPGDVAITSDGAFAYVANSGSASVSVIEIATRSPRATIPVGATPEGLAFAPDGTRLYVANNTGNSITIIDARPVENGPGTAVLGTLILPSAAAGPFRIAFSADGAAAYVTNSRSGNVAVVDPRLVLTDPVNAVPLTVRTGAFPHTVAVSAIAATELQEQP